MTPEAAKMLGAAIAMIGTAGVGIGLGNIIASWLSALARNPGAASLYQTIGFIGLALTEAIALFSLVVALLVLFG